MTAFDNYLQRVRRLESSLWKYLLGTSIFSLVVVAGQLKAFPAPFNALTQVCGVVAGMAGVLPAFMRRLHHISEYRSVVLNYYPFALGFRTTVNLLLVIGAYYVYYRFAVDKSEYCLFFMAAGTFLFFRVMGQSVYHMYMHEEQQRIWGDMSPDQRAEWLSIREEAKELLEETRASGELLEAHRKVLDLTLSDIRATNDRQAVAKLKQRGLMGRLLAFMYPLRRPTLGIRGKLGLLSEQERKQRLAEAEEHVKLLEEGSHTSTADAEQA